MKRLAQLLLFPVLVACTPATTAPTAPREAATEARVDTAAPSIAKSRVTPILDGEVEREEETIAVTDLSK